MLFEYEIFLYMLSSYRAGSHGVSWRNILKHNYISNMENYVSRKTIQTIVRLCNFKLRLLRRREKITKTFAVLTPLNWTLSNPLFYS